MFFVTLPGHLLRMKSRSYVKIDRDIQFFFFFKALPSLEYESHLQSQNYFISFLLRQTHTKKIVVVLQILHQTQE